MGDVQTNRMCDCPVGNTEAMGTAVVCGHAGKYGFLGDCASSNLTVRVACWGIDMGSVG